MPELCLQKSPFLPKSLQSSHCMTRLSGTARHSSLFRTVSLHRVPRLATELSRCEHDVNVAGAHSLNHVLDRQMDLIMVRGQSWLVLMVLKFNFIWPYPSCSAKNYERVTLPVFGKMEVEPLLSYEIHMFQSKRKTGTEQTAHGELERVSHAIPWNTRYGSSS